VRAILIDIERQSVFEVNIEPSPSSLARLCGSNPKVVATLPSGDRLLAVERTSTSLPGFSIGGSAVIRSSGILLGKRDTWTGHMPPRSSTERISALVRWVPAVLGPDEIVKVIVVDPTVRTIETTTITPSLPAIAEVVGMEPAMVYQAPGDDRVYCGRDCDGPVWRMDDVEFRGRCVVIGFDPERGMSDAVASLDNLKRGVRFAFGKPGSWIGYQSEKLETSRSRN
jgi:hypothetical protein